jgi:jasmonate ZIM domain-containing protein
VSHGSCVQRSPGTPSSSILDRAGASLPLDRRDGPADPAAVNPSPMAAAPADTMTRRFAVACGVLSQYVRAGGALAMVPPLFLAPAPAAQQEGANGAAQQLTIFYGGRVVVLDACPPEKAAELIRLAAAAQGAPAPGEAPPLVDMPLVRKASLRRFLAKRKDRSSSTSCAPYDRHHDEEPDQQPAAKKGKVAPTREDAAAASSSSSWLALGSLDAMHGL